MATRFKQGDPTRMPWPQREAEGVAPYTPSSDRFRANPRFRRAMYTPTETPQRSPLRKAVPPMDSLGPPKWPAGAVTLPRCSFVDSDPIITTPLGTHSSQTVAQQNQGRSGFQEYPCCSCCSCHKTVDKHKVYATTVLEGSKNESILVFELAPDNKNVTIEGAPTWTGDPLIKLIVPVEEHLFVASHPHFFVRNLSYCVECLSKMRNYADLMREVQDYCKHKGHFVKISNNTRRPGAVREPFTLERTNNFPPPCRPSSARRQQAEAQVAHQRGWSTQRGTRWEDGVR